MPKARIGLIGDTEGSVPAIEATIAAGRAAGADLLVHCGDIIATPFSPDPPGETIEIVRREGLHCVLGNNDRYLTDWGTDRWEATVARSELAEVDLVLCGHALGPYLQVDYLPGGRQFLVVRASGWPDVGDGQRRTSVAVLTPDQGTWQVHVEPVIYKPRDPTWRWDEKTVPVRLDTR